MQVERAGSVKSLPLRWVEEAGHFFVFLWYSALNLRAGIREWREVLKQMTRVGVESIPVVLFTAAFTGAVIALQTYYGFTRFRAEGLVGAVVALSMLREVAPVLSSLMVTARVGSAMAAEVGSMRNTEQIDALVAMGTDPVGYLFVPRIIASVTMMPLLVIVADLIAIIGGVVASTLLMGANAYEYQESTFAYLELRDFWSGIVKAAVFGLIFSVVCCVKGFHTSGGATGVGHATTRAVVTASLSIVIVDFFLSKLLFVL